MIGTPENTLLRYPDNFQDLVDLGVGDMRFAEMTAARRVIRGAGPARTAGVPA